MSLSSMAVVGAATDGMLQLVCPVVAIVANKIGLQWTAAIGSGIVIASMTVCSFYNEFEVFLVCYGFMMGIGFSFVKLPSLTSCAFFFKARKSMALGIATSGASVGFVVMPVMFSTVPLVLGTKGIFIVVALCFALTIPLIYISYPSKDTVDKRYCSYNLNETFVKIVLIGQFLKINL